MQRTVFDFATGATSVVAMTPSELAEFESSRAARPPTITDVDLERDRRISAGFTFNGKLFQARPEDQKRISGAGTLALGAMMNGALAGDLRWHGGSADFCWIAADNSTVTMDAQTVFAFGQAAANWESDHVFAARALKDADPIPADYTDDAYWPQQQA
ncbi:DUF4376 domain-containing protein [Tianweitania sediminis]|uniref:DUF4376 domain-containing protein n=1 Tax=Tianweitania sediminis TaxID=1502156 RepID=A0A8J7R6A2_9HYPH|nr:DUF4376 domain-containing protein [Tianweitania sediminis]MBP0440695.1 DUF4376 domain-containing protein [Tianweitania sediminis]